MVRETKSSETSDRTTAAAHSTNLSTAAFPALFREETLLPDTEITVDLDRSRDAGVLSLALHLPLLRRELTLEDLPSVVIHQSYFPEEVLQPVAARVCLRTDRALSRELLNSTSFSQGRLRRIVGPDREESYRLMVRGKRADGSQIELEAPLGGSEYAPFRREASAGYLRKTRYLTSGLLPVRSIGRTVAVRLEAQIDVIEAAGGEFMRDFERVVKGSGLSMAVVDCAVPVEPGDIVDSRRIASALRSDDRAFSWLRSAVVLEDHPLERVLRARRIARLGMATIEEKIRRVL